MTRGNAMELDTPAIDTAALQQVGGSLGSNPAGIFQDGHGRRFYVKSLESPAHARNEALAAQLYQLAGAPTLHYVRTSAPNQIATEWVQLDKRHVARLSESERRQAQRWLGVHAWTANWDAAGFEGDNQGLVAGTVVTLDVGGALEFRAQGDPKGKAFGTHVGELDALRRDADNPHAVRLFGDMSDDDVDQAIRVVTRIPDEQIRQLVAGHGGSRALADKMVARKADMAARLHAADRYVSFKGIDFDGNVRKVLAHVDRCRQSDPANRLIAYFDGQRNSTRGARRDDLLLLHSLANPLRDLFEARGDEAALDDLDRLERECF
jgi:hypothetical protein